MTFPHKKKEQQIRNLYIKYECTMDAILSELVEND